MAKIKIEKSAETIAKEEREAKIKAIKEKSNITNSDLKELLIEVLESIKK